MALHFVSPPPEILSSYQESLTDFMGPHDPEVKLYHLPVGRLGLPELAKGATLSDVVRSGCRFLAAWPDRRVTSCEMTNPTLYAQGVFRNFVEGDAAVLAFESIQKAQALDAVQAADFELHYLNIAGIQFEGLHLVSLGGGNDLILPVVSGTPQLDTDVLDAGAFFALARPVAAARLALPISPLSS
jgi:hypothetical protein